jgi:DNA-binding response OmpR family regulator
VFDYKCLIANDEEMILSVLEMLFNANSFETQVCQNGYEAHNIMKNSVSNEVT